MRAIQRGRRIIKRPTIAASGGAAQINTSSSTAMGGISCCMARARQLANSPTAENASMQVSRSSGAARLSKRVRESGAAAERHHDAIDLKRDMGPPETASNPRNVAAFKPGRHAANPTGAVLCGYRMILRRGGSHRYLRRGSSTFQEINKLPEDFAASWRPRFERSNTDSVVWIHWRS